ncbi:hypothetical protein GGR54DRAFT_596552 [Hypoxylon sp. NC1633]|nr:hypothetical protein GGR54DRAFT_596552 [Hypoxylon sp. NC1633]
MTATSNPQIEGDGTQGPPPAYGEVLDKATKQNATALQIKPTPGPARNGRVYNDVPGESSVIFWFESKPTCSMDKQYKPWFGQMDVKCSDVPLLMREGFYWTTENVIREDGYIDNILPERALLNLGKPNNPCTMTRVWTLQDLQQPPRWTACLQVHAPGIEVLTGIRLENWTVDMVRSAYAWGLAKKLIYQYDVAKPRLSFNSIYDDTPLKGWWPWPKEDLLAAKKA